MWVVWLVKPWFQATCKLDKSLGVGVLLSSVICTGMGTAGFELPGGQRFLKESLVEGLPLSHLETEVVI